MSKAVLTFSLAITEVPDAARRSMLREFAANGGKHLVLTSSIISRILCDPAFAGSIKADLAAHGLDFVDSHAPFGPLLDLNSQDTLIPRAAYHKAHLAIGEMMNVDTMTIHIGNDHIAPGDSTDVQIDRISALLDELLPEAEKRNIVITIENIWLPINTPENLWKIKNRFDTPYLGFCYDAGHANLLNNGRLHAESTALDFWNQVNAGTPVWDDAILEKMLPEVVTCHIHDNDGSYDHHQLPGNGNVNWQHTANLLKKAPRLRSIQSEVAPSRFHIPVKTLVETFEKIFNSEDCQEGIK